MKGQYQIFPANSAGDATGGNLLRCSAPTNTGVDAPSDADSAAAVATDTPAPRPSRSGVPERRRVFARANALSSAMFGVLPNPGLGGALAFGIQFGVLSLDAHATLLAPQTTTSPSGLSGSFGFLGLGLRPCVNVAAGRFEVSPCVGLDAFRFSGQGEGTGSDRSQSAWSLAPTAALGFGLHLSRIFTLRLLFQSAAILARPRFVIERDAPIHRPAVFVGGVFFGPEARF